MRETELKSQLGAAGFEPGDRLTANYGRRFIVIGVVILAVELLVQLPGLRAENAGPLALFFVVTAVGVGSVAWWHASRPVMLFESSGLRIAGHAYPWATVRSLEIKTWEVVVETERPHEGPKRFVAVRARPGAVK